MNENKKLIFRLPALTKYVSVYVFLALSFFLMLRSLSDGSYWEGVISILIVYLIFDIYFKKLFCSLEIYRDKLVFKPGGIFWRFFFKKREYYWEKYNFTTYCFHHKNKMHYSSFHIYNTAGKRCFYLKPFFKDLTELVDAVKKYNKNMRLLSLKAEILTKGIRGIFFK